MKAVTKKQKDTKNINVIGLRGKKKIEWNNTKQKCHSWNSEIEFSACAYERSAKLEQDGSVALLWEKEQ